MNLPNIQLVKPKIWDLAGAVVLAGAVLASGANLAISQSATESGSISTGATLLFGVLSLVLCLLGFMVLGKTAEMGTIWGNLLSLGASLVGMSGVLLAVALWALS